MSFARCDQRATECEQREGVGSPRIEDVDGHAQVHRLLRSDCLAQTCQEQTEGIKSLGIENFIELVGHLITNPVQFVDVDG